MDSAHLDDDETLHHNIKIVRNWLATHLKSVPDLPSATYRSREHFVLHHGRPYRPQHLPLPYRRGPIRACFHNSFKLAKQHDLRYVEGFAVPHDIHVPVHHAWCVTADNLVVDATWGEPGLVYLGVVFPLDLVASRTGIRVADGNGVLDDGHKQWPALQRFRSHRP